MKDRFALSLYFCNFVVRMCKCLKSTYLLLLLVVALWVLPASGSPITQGGALTAKDKADACYQAGNFSDALDYYTQALDIAKQESNDKVYYACLGNIGNIYSEMGDYKRGLHYYLLGYDAAKRAGDQEGQWRFTTCLVGSYCLLKDIDNARVFMREQNKLPMSDVTIKKYYFLQNQALVAESEGNIAMATYYNKEALDYAADKQLPVQYSVDRLVSLGHLCLTDKKPQEALGFLQAALDSVKAAKRADFEVKLYKDMAEAYKQLGQPDKAQELRNRYLQLSDSVFNREQFNLSNNKLFEYENEENQRHIDTLVERSYMQLAVIGVFALLIVALGWLYYSLRRKHRDLQQAQQLLVSKNEDLIKSRQTNKDLLEQISPAATAESAATQQADETATPGDSAAEPMIGEEQKNRILSRILAVMEDIAVISDNNFSLNVLAERVGSNTKYVSWVINDTFNKNFKTLLNEYRIKEACRRLSDHEHYGNMTIQAIYEELGYNSPGSFIQAFKRVNGMTPSMYQKLAASRLLSTPDDEEEE